MNESPNLLKQGKGFKLEPSLKHQTSDHFYKSKSTLKDSKQKNVSLEEEPLGITSKIFNPFND